MVSIYQLKPAFQKRLYPVMHMLINMQITANQVTFSTILLSISIGTALAIFPTSTWTLLVVPGFLLLRMALNAIDGMIARTLKTQSVLGELLNEIGDVVSDAALYLPIALHPSVSSHHVVLLVVLAIISEMMGVMAKNLAGKRGYDGPLGKRDRAFFFGILALLLALGLTHDILLNFLLNLALFLSVLTVFNRANSVLKDGSGVFSRES